MNERSREVSNGAPSNMQFTKDGLFLQACHRAQVQPTKRQASKFRNKRGLAWLHRKPAVQDV